MTDDAVKLAYKPRKHFMPFHNRRTPFACMVAHRRAGKTVASVNEIIHRALYFKKRDRQTQQVLKRPRYAYIAPLLKQGKKIAWEYLKEYTQGLEKKKPSESELTVTLRHNDAEIGIYGADNPDAFRGQYFDGVVLDEYGDMSPSVWSQVLLPALSDREGWAVFIGTFKGKNHFYSVFRRSQGLDLKPGESKEDIQTTWFNLLLKASESGVFSPDQLQNIRREMDEEEYRQEYECDPNAVVRGTYYAKILNQLEANKQIYADIQWEHDQPVEAIFDIGFTDSTAIWFLQRRPGGLGIIDYEEASGQAVNYYTDLLFSKGYRYSTVWLPPDARAKSFQTGRSTIEQFRAADLPVRICPNLGLQDGISAARKILPLCYFSPKTELGVEALRAYKRSWDEDRKCFGDHPVHDWSSHASDAFRYLALVAQAIDVSPEKAKIIIPTPQIQLQVLFEERERLMRRRGRHI